MESIIYLIICSCYLLCPICWIRCNFNACHTCQDHITHYVFHIKGVSRSVLFLIFINCNFISSYIVIA